MKPLKAISMGAVLLAVSMLCGSSLQAQSTFKRITHVNFSGPVEVPGKVLPAGDYVFQVDVLSNSDDRIVQIRDKDGVNVIATALTVNDERLKPTGDTVMLFRERAADQPPALRAWFYPGEDIGHEFVYGRKRASELAAANGVNVPSVADNTADSALNNARVTQETPTGQEEAVTNTATPAPAPAPTTAQTPEPVATNQNNNNNNNNNNDNRDNDNLVVSNRPLPKTASEIPLVALAGTLFVGLGAALAFVGRRRSPKQISS